MVSVVSLYFWDALAKLRVCAINVAILRNVTKNRTGILGMHLTSCMPTTSLQFYALYKQAKNGPCNIPKPAFWDVIGKAKWYVPMLTLANSPFLGRRWKSRMVCIHVTCQHCPTSYCNTPFIFPLTYVAVLDRTQVLFL